MAKRFILPLLLLLTSFTAALASDHYKSAARYNYYTSEQTAEVAVWVPDSRSGVRVSVDIVYAFDHILRGAEVKAGQFNIFAFPLETFSQGHNELTVSYMENGKWVDSDKIELLVLPGKYNAVKIDRISGGLIVEGLPFIPFGFYTYSPVQPGLAEEEAVKGFNMMSPYQEIRSKTFRERKEYMDRCAELGMKVNYNLLSLAGGGGVGHQGHERLSHRKRIKMLKKEIEAFRDHPALLSWYISDEPVGQGVPPDSLAEVYGLIRELDPYHPVTVVFMTPAMARDYSHVMDIVMADPYPVPHGSVLEVGKVTDMLQKEFFLEKPVWIVPQAFGGNEHWEREPTPREMRVMTYLAMINGASGIQYFIRQGLNAFPKSTIAWNECGAMALEMAELTPFFFAAGKPPLLKSPDKDLQFRVLADDGAVLVMVVNPGNKPSEFSFTLEDLPYSGSAAVMFEDRMVEVREGRVVDIIDAYGTRTYLVRYKMPSGKGPRVQPRNLVLDPSFENTTGTGIPASCYARPQGDRGATYFIDPRIAARGGHSLRMTAPSEGGGMKLSFYGIRIEPGQSYTMSIQARSVPLRYREVVKKSFFRRLCGCGPDASDHPLFTMALGGTSESFIPGNDWQEYAFSCIPEPESGVNRVSPTLALDGKGTAWFDLLQVYPDMAVTSNVNRDNNNISIGLSTVHKGAEIFYTLDGEEPGRDAKQFDGIFNISTTSTLKAAAYLGDKKAGYLERPFVVSYATGRYVEYRNKYSAKYDAGLMNGLVDGILASPDFMDGKWQGFEGDDLDITINLREVRDISSIRIRFLEDRASWIFLPRKISILYSVDGVEYELLGNPEQELVGAGPGSGVYAYVLAFAAEPLQARYVRIVAENIGSCPEGHPGQGGKAWLFTDELIIK